MVREYLKRELPYNLLEEKKGDLVFDTNIIFDQLGDSVLDEICCVINMLSPSINHESFKSTIEKHIMSKTNPDKIYSLLILAKWMLFNHDENRSNNIN